MTIRITNGTHEDHRIAAAVAGKCKVVSCPNPADAASPVHLYAGDHLTVLGQSADYRHHIDPLGEFYDAAVVQSWWDNGAQEWYTTIEGLDNVDADIRRIVRSRENARVERDTAERRDKEDAARKIAGEEAKRTHEAIMELARAAGEEWAPGRTATKVSRTGELIVGRWDAPYIPGSGRPDEVRQAKRNAAGEIILVDCAASFAYCWA